MWIVLLYSIYKYFELEMATFELLVVGLLV